MSMVHSGQEAVMRGELVARLGLVIKEHNRLATWNREKDRPARVAFHHDAALAIRDAITLIKATTANSVGTEAEGRSAPTTPPVKTGEG